MLKTDSRSDEFQIGGETSGIHGVKEIVHFTVRCKC